MQEIVNKISTDLDVNLSSQMSEQQILMHIADRVEQLLKGDPDLMMSYLYRLDVEEKKITAALKTSPMPAHVTFAHLIWDRQKQRMASKKKYKQNPIEGWEL